LGDDRLLVDARGRSSISMEDFAIALIDELEHRQHVRQRFTASY
jgi:putative NADH-flavin reductase